MQASPPESSANMTGISSKSALSWTALVAVALVMLQLELVFSKSINWDEFFHLSQIHAKLRGEYVQWLQTPHVFLFRWVPSLVPDSINQVIAIRLMLFPLGGITAFLIWDCARRLTDPYAAAIAALSWLGAGYVFTHSFALRADIIAAFLLTLAMWSLIAMKGRYWALAFAGLLSAIAFVATVKSVLYAPALAALLAWRFGELRNWRWALAAVGLVAVVFALAIMLLPSSVTSSVTRVFQSSADRMFNAGPFPQGQFLLLQIAMAPVFSGIAAIAAWSAFKGKNAVLGWLIIGLILPIFSVAIYRNAYPYFFAFILPPVAIAGAFGVQALLKRYSYPLVLALIFIGAVVMSVIEDRKFLEQQRVVHAGIAEIFPEPVHYIDDVAFEPAMPRAVSHFASGWALAGYRKRGEPIYRYAMSAAPAPMLFRHGYALENLDPAVDDEEALLVEDAKALRENYIQHWGRVFVAGKNFQASQADREVQIEIPGIYTVEGATLTIDGRQYYAGDTIGLRRGTIVIGPVDKAGSTLRWGDNIAVPATPFPTGWLFTNY